MSFLLLFLNNRQNFLTFDYWHTYPEREKVFFDSQYRNPHPAGFIPDEIAYGYAGGALIRGGNPVEFIPEAPPLGKYLIGLSAVVFNNANILVLVFGILGLVMYYLVARQILRSQLLSLLAVVLVITEELYRNQYVYVPLFDLFQFFFLFGMFYFFNGALKTSGHVLRYMVFAQICVGCFIATKFFMSGIALVLPMVFTLIIQHDFRRLKVFILTSWIPVVVLLMTYLRVFAYGYTWNKFLGIQKWIFIYWKGAVALPFTIWDLLFFNRWHTWWGDNQMLSDPQWSITWPIIACVCGVTILVYIFRIIPRKKELEVLLWFAVWYGLFLSIGISTARYFVIYLPVLYLIGIYGITEYLLPFIYSRSKTRIS